MVIDPDLSPSRAGFLPLVGGNLALDFANTESGRGFDTHQNHLLEASNVLDWLDHTNTLLARRHAMAAGRNLSARRPRPRPPRRRRGAARRHSRCGRRDRSRRRAGRGLACSSLGSVRPLHGTRLSRRRDTTRVTGAGACATRRSKRPSVRSPSPLSGYLPRATSAASRNAAVTPAAGSSRHEQEQSSALVRDGGLRQSRQAEAASGPEARRLIRLLTALLAAGLLAGCSPVLETDQARLCRMALAALTPEDSRIAIVSQRPDPDGRGLTVAFTAEPPGGEPESHAASCRFREPGRPRESRDLTSLTIDGVALSDTELYFLIRYWLATPEGRAADPCPARRPEPRARSCASRRLRSSDGARRAAAVGDLRASGGGLFARLRADRAHQLRLRRARRRGRIWSGDGGARACGLWPASRCSARPSCSPQSWRQAGALRRRAPSSFRCVTPGDSRRWWRRSASRSFFRNSCASPRAIGQAG